MRYLNIIYDIHFWTKTDTWHILVSAWLAERNELSYSPSCFPQLKWRHLSWVEIMIHLWQHSAWFSSRHSWIKRLDSISISPVDSFPVPLIPMEQWLQLQLGYRLRLRKSHLHRQQKEGMPKGVNCFLKTRNEDPLMLIVEKQLKMSHLNQLVKSHLKQLIMSNLKHQLWRSQLNPFQRGSVSHHHLNQQT